MTFASILMPPAAVRWELSGPAGIHVDEIVSLAIGSGCTVEPIEAGTRYRLAGDPVLLAALAEQVAKVDGFALALEAPPKDVIRVTGKVRPARDYRRVTYVHGPAFAMVARAVDAHLDVGTVGVLRWSVTGPSSVQSQWLADAKGVSVADALALWQVTPEQIALEDASLSVSVPIRIELPARRTTTQSIVRNPDGDIVRVDSIEQDAQ